MTHRPRGPQRGRNSWSVLAVLLGALAGVSIFGFNTSFAGSPSIAEHTRDMRAPGNPVSVRPDSFDPSLNFGGLDEPGPALAAREHDPDLWTTRLHTPRPVAFDLPISVERTRDGRSRAPPSI